jgi:glycerol dehydratase large subunit
MIRRGQSVSRSAYASRGLKMRYTSGTGSGADGLFESKSMLYLESLHLYHQRRGRTGAAKRCGQLYRHDRRCAVGIRAVLAENLIASMLDLEVASANDQTFSHSIFAVPPHPDADAAGHRLYFLRLQRGTELRQHVCRLELRR